MARPLRLDDQFVSIVNDKIHDKFLNIFSIKVQSTAFCQKLNLRQSLTICSVIDLLVGLIVFLDFFRIMEIKEEGFLFIVENLLFISAIIFGLIGIDAAQNLKKRNGYIYKTWRVFMIFAIPIIEIFQSFEDFCYYNWKCSFLYFVFVSALYIAINLYMTRIAWSFNIRMQRNHELLIVHGKYLESMMADENISVQIARTYRPPKLSKAREEELINLPSQMNVLEEQMFAPRDKHNPFFTAMQQLNK